MGVGSDGTRRLIGQYTGPSELVNEFANGSDDVDAMVGRAQGAQIKDRETDYQKRRFQRKLSPTRADAFSNGDQEAEEGRSYRDVMKERELEKDEERVRRKIEEKMRNGDQDGMDGVEHEASLKEEPDGDKENRAENGDGTRKRVRNDSDTSKLLTRSRKSVGMSVEIMLWLSRKKMQKRDQVDGMLLQFQMQHPSSSGPDGIWHLR